jgi:hypothetical protein
LFESIFILRTLGFYFFVLVAFNINLDLAGDGGIEFIGETFMDPVKLSEGPLSKVFIFLVFN